MTDLDPPNAPQPMWFIVHWPDKHRTFENVTGSGYDEAGHLQLMTPTGGTLIVLGPGMVVEYGPMEAS